MSGGDLTLMVEANIGNCVLKQENSRKSDDVQAVGALLVSLKEPGTSGRKPGTLHLERPHDVSELCNDFIRQCATSSAEALLQVSGTQTS